MRTVSVRMGEFNTDRSQFGKEGLLIFKWYFKRSFFLKVVTIEVVLLYEFH